MSDSAVLLYVSGIRCECVTQLLINPIIRTRTCLISGVYQPTRHNITMNLTGIGWGGVNRINLAQVRDLWRALVNTVMNLRVP
jgi:hypothetical protein